MRRVVRLDEGRQALCAPVRSGKAPARKIALATLKADEVKKDAQVAENTVRGSSLL